jgi:hypothetical protein
MQPYPEASSCALSPAGQTATDVLGQQLLREHQIRVAEWQSAANTWKILFYAAAATAVGVYGVYAWYPNYKATHGSARRAR